MMPNPLYMRVAAQESLKFLRHLMREKLIWNSEHKRVDDDREALQQWEFRFWVEREKK